MYVWATVVLPLLPAVTVAVTIYGPTTSGFSILRPATWYTGRSDGSKTGTLAVRGLSANVAPEPAGLLDNVQTTPAISFAAMPASICTSRYSGSPKPTVLKPPDNCVVDGNLYVETSPVVNRRIASRGCTAVCAFIAAGTATASSVNAKRPLRGVKTLRFIGISHRLMSYSRYYENLIK